MFTEQDERVARPRALLTTRACRWATEQLRREHASIHELARQRGCTWRTVCRSIEQLLEQAAADESRFEGVTTLGVDEHVRHHVSPLRPGPKELSGMVDLTRRPDPKNPDKLVVKARPVDLIAGRSGPAYDGWLCGRGEALRARVEMATLDAVDEVRRRVQEIHGHRGRENDAIYRIRNILHAGAEHLTERQQARLAQAIAAD